MPTLPSDQGCPATHWTTSRPSCPSSRSSGRNSPSLLPRPRVPNPRKETPRRAVLRVGMVSITDVGRDRDDGGKRLAFTVSPAPGSVQRAVQQRTVGHRNLDAPGEIDVYRLATDILDRIGGQASASEHCEKNGKKGARLHGGISRHQPRE